MKKIYFFFIISAFVMSSLLAQVFLIEFSLPISDDLCTPRIITPLAIEAGNISCAEVGEALMDDADYFSLCGDKIDYVEGAFEGSFPDGLTVEVETDGIYLSFEIMGECLEIDGVLYKVGAVIVKGGPQSNTYFYPDGSTGDSGLAAPDHNSSGAYAGLSNLSFCFVECDDPLPVTLSAFTAIYDNSTPTLQWTTQSESDNLGWNIYRSISENMGQANQINDLLITGNGTTSEPTDYVYNDLSDVESNTTYWYWLESASYNGETELYGPVTLTIQDEENQLPELPTASVLHNNYPNPFNPSTMINFSINLGESGDLTIYNMKGQIMETLNYDAGEHQFSWDARNYSSGIYFYKLETQNYTNIKKMIMVK